jgi:tetrahydromethanopterin S-methyltransferase subunit C
MIYNNNSMDYVKLITGIIVSILGLFIILIDFPEIGGIIVGLIICIIGFIIIFNHFENKIEEKIN